MFSNSRSPDKLHIFISTMPISSPNPMFNHLLESSRRDDSNKWTNIGFGEEIKQVEWIEVNFMCLIVALNRLSIFTHGMKKNLNVCLNTPSLPFPMQTICSSTQLLSSLHTSRWLQIIQWNCYCKLDYFAYFRKWYQLLENSSSKFKRFINFILNLQTKNLSFSC